MENGAPLPDLPLLCLVSFLSVSIGLLSDQVGDYEGPLWVEPVV